MVEVVPRPDERIGAVVRRSLENCFMPKRNLRVMKWLGTTPAIAVCTDCNKEFRVPLELLKRVAGSHEYLKREFSRHQCTEKFDRGTVGE
jgi:hypothetical protein